MSTCNYCKKTLSNANTLKTHQNNAKYCLKIQGKNKVEEITKECESEEPEIIVQECDSDQEQDVHELSEHDIQMANKKLLDIEISVVKDIILYEHKLKELRSLQLQLLHKHTIVGNYLNLSPLILNVQLTDTRFSKSFTYEMVNDDEKLLNFLLESDILVNENGEEMYKIVDRENKIFKFLNDNNNTSTDLLGYGLISCIKPFRIRHTYRVCREKGIPEDDIEAYISKF